ncbi:hypothetical protein [Streptomyces achromogenes]
MSATASSAHSSVPPGSGVTRRGAARTGPKGLGPVRADPANVSA